MGVLRILVDVESSAVGIEAKDAFCFDCNNSCRIVVAKFGVTIQGPRVYQCTTVQCICGPRLALRVCTPGLCDIPAAEPSMQLTMGS